MSRVRENSFAAWRDGNTAMFSEREIMCLRAVTALGITTDREIMQRLGFVDPNAVRPRLTALIDDGVLEECGNCEDAVTHKTVRKIRLVTRAPAPPPMAQLALL
jgi:predicted HTH transcriptional regulator